ncbi:hypothetical protein G4V62_01390 [Bacillaceae bacterium SIJ1]|uniref:hypothetical protein n=1 Tax=Litoribacterium kuwaitense TaxID=1398745 RepID=UPI0013EC6776|nr:hypothetical protein [Litoribacterium kuwaitense]NGP43680.1 hypothetical protein [Litoribacterium kuwaitense]
MSGIKYAAWVCLSFVFFTGGIWLLPIEKDFLPSLALAFQHPWPSIGGVLLIIAGAETVIKSLFIAHEWLPYPSFKGACVVTFVFSAGILSIFALWLSAIVMLYMVTMLLFQLYARRMRWFN